MQIEIAGEDFAVAGGTSRPIRAQFVEIAKLAMQIGRQKQATPASCILGARDEVSVRYSQCAQKMRRFVLAAQRRINGYGNKPDEQRGEKKNSMRPRLFQHC